MSDGLLKAAVSRRSLIKWSAVGSAAAALPFGLQGASAADKVVATLITDTAGLGDQNFNDLADAGGKKAAADLGIEWKVIESADAAAYEPNLTAGADQSDLTIGIGFLLHDAITTVAAKYPDKKFLLVDSQTDAKNVQSVTFKEHEAAFLAGVVSGKSTKSNKLGIVGGQRVPPVMRYEVGFVAGVKTVNAAAEIIITYTDTFGDPALGKKTAEAQFGQGADILLPIAGATGSGCYQAAKEKGDGFLIASADTSQDHLAPGHELVVAQKGVDTSIYAAIKAVVDGSFKGGVEDLGIKEGGVSLQDPGKKVAPDVMALAMAFQKMILDGSLTVPADDAALKAFTPPALPTVEASPEATPA